MIPWQPLAYGVTRYVTVAVAVMLLTRLSVMVVPLIVVAENPVTDPAGVHVAVQVKYGVTGLTTSIVSATPRVVPEQTGGVGVLVK